MCLLDVPWERISELCSAIHDSPVSPTFTFDRMIHTFPHDVHGYIFKRNIDQIHKKNKDIEKLCSLQMEIYQKAGIKVNFSLTDLIELTSMAEQFGRCMRLLTEYDIELLKQKEIDFRLCEQEDLFLGCNIATTVFLKSISHSASLHPTMLLINCLFQRTVNTLFIPPLVRSLGEFTSSSHDKHDLLNILSRLRVTPSLKTILKDIQKSRNKYTKPVEIDKPVICCIDNIDIAKTVHLHTIEKEDSTYYHGTNQIEYQPDLVIPEENSSITRLPIENITTDFIKPTEFEKDLLYEFIDVSYQVCMKYGVQNPHPKLTPILNPAHFDEEDSENTNKENATDTRKIDPMEEMWGLNTTTGSTQMSDIYNRVSPGKPTDTTTLKDVLTKLTQRYPHARKLIINADQAIFDIYQDIKDDLDFRHISKQINMNLEIWHVQLTMDKSIMSAYLIPLKPLLVALGYISDSHVQYLVKCGNLHRTHYILEAVNIAIVITISEEYLKENPNVDPEFDMYADFEEWLNQKLPTSPQLKLWVQFVKAFSISHAAWVAQRVGNWQLFHSTLSVNGFTPFFFSWGHCNYDHSVTEQLLQDSLDSDYEKFVKINNSNFIRYKSSNVLMANGTKQELYVKYTKSYLPKLIDDERVSKVADILVPLEMNKQNLHTILEVPDRYRHKIHNIDPREIDNLRCFIRNFNIIGICTSSEELHYSETVIESDDASICDENVEVLEQILQSSFEIESDNDESVTHLSTSDKLSIVKPLLVMSTDHPVSIDDIYWNSIDTDYLASVQKVQQQELVDWYSKIPINSKFLDSFKHGTTMMKLFSEQVCNQKSTGRTVALKKEIRDKLTTITYDLNPKKNASTNTNTVTQYSATARELIAKSIPTEDEPTLQSFDIQFSPDGFKRHKPEKSMLKKIIKDRFGPAFISTTSSLPNLYQLIAVDINYVLFHNLSRDPQISSHTKAFVKYHIEKYIQHTSLLILAFDTDIKTTLLKSQERYERNSKSTPTVPLTVRTFEGSKIAPIAALRRTDRPTRAHYAKVIIQELVHNPKEYLRNICTKDFIIIISGIALDSSHQFVLPLYIEYLHSSGTFEIKSAPGIQHQHGQGEDAIFEIAHTIHYPSSEKLLFVSPDTDTLVKAIAVHSQFNCVMHVSSPSPTMPTSDFFDITTFIQLLEQAYNGATYPIHTFVFLLLDQGISDFTCSWYGIGLKRSLNIFDKYPVHDLVTSTPQLPLTDELLNNINWSASLPYPSLNYLKKALHHRVIETTPSLKEHNLTYDQLRPLVFKTKNNARHSFPSTGGLSNHFLRTVLAFQHFFSIQSCPHSSEHILKFGFTKIDKHNEISLNNCKFDFNASVQDIPSNKQLCKALTKAKQPCTRYSRFEGLCTQHYRSANTTSATSNTNKKLKTSN